MKDTILRLQLATDPSWAYLADENMEEILTDHAWCEQKAASSCTSLIVQYPDRPELVDRLTPVVAEEWEHFTRVIEQIRKRGFVLGKQRKDEYVLQLMQLIRKGGSAEQRLMDKLLVNGMIEARSCERFKMLWQNLEEEELKAFYYDLMKSEAGHYVNFLDLAREYMPKEMVNRRWREILAAEAEIVSNLGVRGNRMH
jgi:tRNA 2-(methylsulfanyl)-N6-isopentenyladenosine37 hydroxylase